MSIRFLDSRVYEWLATEDSIIEYSQFLFYLLGAFFSLKISIYLLRLKHAYLAGIYIFLSLALLFISGEEISWGQRIFGHQTSEFLSIHNSQNETNIHNLHSLAYGVRYAYILVGFLGSFLFFLVPKKWQEVDPFAARLLIPPKFLFFYFLPVFLYYLADEIIRVRLNIFYTLGAQEIAEFCLALGGLLFLYRNWLWLKRHNA